MRMYLATVGSRGDYEPFERLAMVASEQGHEVHFAHTADFSPKQPVPYIPYLLPGSFEDILSAGFSLVKSLAAYRTVIQPMLESIYDASTLQIMSIRPDVVVYHPKLVTAAPAAHAAGALAVMAELVPTLTPTRDFPSAGFPLRVPASLNRATFAVIQAGLASFGNPAKKLAENLGVTDYAPDMALCPVSPSIVPPPHDWPPHAHITGHWLSSTTGEADSELDSFLDRAPTIYVGFGSMNDGQKNGATRASVILEANRRLGHQTLFVTGWGGVSVNDEQATSADVLVRHGVHHDSVFPRVAVALHHGGAGTTQRALLSGTPSVIMPFLADQPWWANRLHSHNLGPAAVPKRTKSPNHLVRTLREAQTKKNQVKLVADMMAEENGPETALRLIHQSLDSGNSRSAA